MTEHRKYRQQRAIVAALARGDVARALALAHEHLLEYPDDAVVRVLVETMPPP